MKKLADFSRWLFKITNRDRIEEVHRSMRRLRSYERFGNVAQIRTEADGMGNAMLTLGLSRKGEEDEHADIL